MLKVNLEYLESFEIVFNSLKTRISELNKETQIALSDIINNINKNLNLIKKNSDSLDLHELSSELMRLGFVAQAQRVDKNILQIIDQLRDIGADLIED